MARGGFSIRNSGLRQDTQNDNALELGIVSYATPELGRGRRELGHDGAWPSVRLARNLSEPPRENPACGATGARRRASGGADQE